MTDERTKYNLRGNAILSWWLESRTVQATPVSEGNNQSLLSRCNLEFWWGQVCGCQFLLNTIFCKNKNVAYRLGLLGPWRWDRQVVPKRRKLTTYQRRATSLKSEDLIHNAAEAWNYGWRIPLNSFNIRHILPFHAATKLSFVLSFVQYSLYILGKWPTWCTITLYKTFIIIILYMSRATLCSSSGGQIVLIQHLV